ncbi:hypothetical protein BS47DRAFT_1372736 [Hydnum rufescens UP504]|uniref:pyridoxal kinase n=1 Tax=Hydnum rufescens UP504 TaxID=1448309 RepID=A0A9P6DSZ0_9AGAM|nr:hypothetical protein BS47DRAFT_1372736 [Hydnum rufescens UP504]
MSGRVLSIQSHVVSGYVGNKAATFPLQVLGYDVDAVNTVQYSNHAGYRRFAGTNSQATELDSIFEAMKKNGLFRANRILTGYVPNASSLQSIANLIKWMCSGENEIMYLLDPVMGDDGRLYVSPDVVPVYRDVLLPLATVITPNWFEVEILTGIKITTMASIKSAVEKLHSVHGVPHVVISSLPLTAELEAEVAAVTRPAARSNSAYSGDNLLCITSSASAAKEGPVSNVHAICIPRIKGYYSGVGDLFSALVLAHFRPTEGSEALSDATTLALSTIQEILLRTYEHCESLAEEERPPTDDEADAADAERRVRRMRARELRIIQNMECIRNPPRERCMARWTGFWD